MQGDKQSPTGENTPTGSPSPDYLKTIRLTEEERRLLVEEAKRQPKEAPEADQSP